MEKEKEMCVLCGKPTGSYKDAPIHQRRNYVEGVGDICDQCAEKMEAEAKSARKERIRCL